MTEDDTDKMIRAYVPESDHVGYYTASFLAMDRDKEAAKSLEHDWIIAQPEGYLDSIAQEALK